MLNEQLCKACLCACIPLENPHPYTNACAAPETLTMVETQIQAAIRISSLQQLLGANRGSKSVRELPCLHYASNTTTS